jgi:septum formation inhibitor MinC
VSSQFWQGTNIALNLGQLELNTSQVGQVLAIAKGVGATPKQVFAKSGLTRTALREHNVPLGAGEPMSLPTIDPSTLTQQDLSDEDNESSPQNKSNDPATQLHSAVVYEENVTDEVVFGSGSNNLQIHLDPRSEEDPDRFSELKVSDLPLSPPTPAVLYLRQTLRSGQTVSHAGHLVIIGDVNPGAEIMAEGDITIWGALRGIAHAGIGGNLEAEIRALKLQPIQIRIAHAIARSPDRPRVKYATGGKVAPETARIVDGKIKISRSNIE